MESNTLAFPTGGICLDACQHLFLVDIGGIAREPAVRERRAFVDLGEAVKFIGGRAARLSAFLSPLGISSEAAIYGLVEEALESSVSRTHLLRFSNSPSLMVKLTPSTHRGQFETFRRIYPPAGPDV